MSGIDPQDLIRALQAVQDLLPGARLHKNQVGNLAIIHNGEYVGFLDLATSQTEIFDTDFEDRR